jgi:WD40 repeat protein
MPARTALKALEYPIRYLLADDIFISYSRVDGIIYAEGLASELAKRRFSCRVDLWETTPGGQIPNSLKRALRWSKSLVLIGTNRALESAHVRWEIQEFLSTSGIVIPIGFDNAIQDPTWFPEIQGLPITSETDPTALVTGKPSLSVLSRIENSAKFRRRNRRIRDLTVAALSLLIVLTALSLNAGKDAVRALREARLQQEAAKQAEITSSEQKRLADIATRNRLIADQHAKEASEQEQIARRSAAEEQQRAERARRVADLEELSTERLRQFQSGMGELESLESAIDDGQSLLALTHRAESFGEYPTVSPVYTLNQILSNIHEKNRLLPGGALYNLSLSYDGRQLAFIRSDQRVGSSSLWVWDISGKPLWHCGSINADVNGVDFDRIQRGVVVATQTRGYQFWDASCMPTALRVGDSVNIDRLHNLFAEKGPNDSVRITDMAGSTIATLSLGPHQIKDIRANPTGSLILASGPGPVIDVWRGNRWTQYVDAHGQYIQDFQFTGDGKYVVVEYHGGAISVWNLSHDLVGNLNTTDGYHSLWMSPVGSQFATAGRNVQIWNINGQLKNQFPIDSPISDLRFTADGSHLAVVAFDTVRFLDSQGGPLFRLAGHVGAIRQFYLLPGEQGAITAGVDGTVRLWDLSDHVSRRLGGSGHRIQDFAFVRDNKGIITISDDGSVTFWNDRDEQTGHWTASQQTDRAKISPDGKRIALFYSKTFEIRDLDGKVVPASVNGANWSSVLQSAFSPDGKVLVTSHAGGMIQIQHLAIGKSTSKPTQGWVYGLAFDQTGATIAAAIRTNVLFFDTSGNLLRQMDSGQELLDVEFSQDGRYMATAGADGTVGLWTPSGKPVRKMSGNSGRVLTVCFSADSQMLATASEDQSVRIWDLKGREIASFQAPVSSVTMEVSGGGFIGPPLKFSPDGHWLALGDRTGVVHIWPVDRLNSLLDRGAQWLGAYRSQTARAAE